MGFKRKFNVDEIADTVVNKAGEDELKNKRTVVLISDPKGLSMRLTGYPGELSSFVAGDNVVIEAKFSQTKLDVEEEEE